MKMAGTRRYSNHPVKELLKKYLLLCKIKHVLIKGTTVGNTDGHSDRSKSSGIRSEHLHSGYMPSPYAKDSKRSMLWGILLKPASQQAGILCPRTQRKTTGCIRFGNSPDMLYIYPVPSDRYPSGTLSPGSIPSAHNNKTFSDFLR